MVIYPRYRLYPITPDTPIDPNNQHIIFSNIPFYQVIFPLYPQLNHHGFFVGEFSPFYHVLLCGFTDEFPIQQYCQMAFSVYSHIVLEYSTYVPYFFCIVLVFKYIYISIYNIVFATFPIHSLKLSYISYIYTHILHIFLIQRFFKPSTNHISKARQWLVIHPSCLVDIFEAKFQVFAPQRFWVAKKLLALVDGHWIAASL